MLNSQGSGLDVPDADLVPDEDPVSASKTRGHCDVQRLADASSHLAQTPDLTVIRTQLGGQVRQGFPLLSCRIVLVQVEESALEALNFKLSGQDLTHLCAPWTPETMENARGSHEFTHFPLAGLWNPGSAAPVTRLKKSREAPSK